MYKWSKMQLFSKSHVAIFQLSKIKPQKSQTVIVQLTYLGVTFTKEYAWTKNLSPCSCSYSLHTILYAYSTFHPTAFQNIGIKKSLEVSLEIYN